MMNIRDRFKAEFARTLRGFKYERTPNGIWFPKQKALFGGVFGYRVDDSEWKFAHNAWAYEGLDAMLSGWFNNGTAPSAYYIAPFSNNVAPTSSLKAADFPGTQGEYTGYTETTRQQWIPNGPSSGQSMSSSASPAKFTVGASAATVYGACLIATASGKGSTAGSMIAGALFGVGNTLNPGSTFSVQYILSAAPG